MEKIKYNQDARIRNINAEIRMLYDAVNQLIDEVNFLKEKANAGAELQSDEKRNVGKTTRRGNRTKSRVE